MFKVKCKNSRNIESARPRERSESPKCLLWKSSSFFEFITAEWQLCEARLLRNKDLEL